MSRGLPGRESFPTLLHPLPGPSPPPHIGLTPVTVPSTIDVVAAVILDPRRRVLLGRRPAHKRHGGLWEFPGGKVDPGESLAEAAARELAEELGLETLEVRTDPLLIRMDPGHPFRILFLPVRASGTVRAMEHSEVRWVETARPVDLPLAPSDAAFLDGAVRGRIPLPRALVSDVVV